GRAGADRRPGPDGGHHRAQRRGGAHRPARPGPVPVDLQALALAPGRQRRTQSLRTDRAMIEIEDLGPGTPSGPQAPEGDEGWQPLPPRARPLFMLSGALGAGVPGLIALAVGGFVLLQVERTGLLAAAVAAWLLLVAFGT